MLFLCFTVDIAQENPTILSHIIKNKSLQVTTINPSYNFCNMFSNLQNALNIVRVFLGAFDD